MSNKHNHRRDNSGSHDLGLQLGIVTTTTTNNPVIGGILAGMSTGKGSKVCGDKGKKSKHHGKGKCAHKGHHHGEGECDGTCGGRH